MQLMGMERFQVLLKIVWVWGLILTSLPVWPADVGLAVASIGDRERKFHEHLSKLAPKHKISLLDKTQLDTARDAWVVITDAVLTELATHHPEHQQVLVLFSEDTSFGNVKLRFPQLNVSRLQNVPSIERQLTLIRALKPQVGPVGVYYSQHSEFVVEEAQAAAKKLGLNIMLAKLNDPLNWDRPALRVLKQADVILGVNDEFIYNATNIRSILMRLYRASRPLVGPDKAFVKAGAVASTYSGMGETIQATADLLNNKIKWVDVVYNPYFDVSINRQVARSLQISIEGEDSLKKKVGGGLPK